MSLTKTDLNIAYAPESLHQTLRTNLRRQGRVHPSKYAADFAARRPLEGRGEGRLAGALDLPATFRKYACDPAMLGTNDVISTTATRIQGMVALTGCASEREAPGAILIQQQAGIPLPPISMLVVAYPRSIQVYTLVVCIPLMAMLCYECTHIIP
ncbi:MAG: hypothetical protein ACUVS4_15070 [Chloroflexaceae bacterium]